MQQKNIRRQRPQGTETTARDVRIAGDNIDGVPLYPEIFGVFVSEG